LTKNKQFKIKPDRIDNAVRSYNNYLSMYGGGGDFYINNECNNNESSYNNFGHTYELPDGI
jgi:hypothetical protein